MKDAHETHDLQQRTEQWLVNTAQDAYADPKNHLLEMGAAVLAIGAATLITRGAISRLSSSAGLFANAMEEGAATGQSAVRLNVFRPKIFDFDMSAAESRHKLWESGNPVSRLESTAKPTTLDLPELSIQGQAVGQATYAIAPLDVPLATRGLSTCRALVVQDKRAGLHYLAHLDSGVVADQIRDSLKGFDLGRSNLYVMRGAEESGVTHEVIEALRGNKKALRNLKFIAPEDAQPDAGLISYQGRILKLTRDVADWPKFETEPPTADDLAFLYQTSKPRA
jgi:hypothetical protein